MAHAHIAVNEQHHAVARACEIGEQFRVAAIVVAREIERFLADWPGADGVDCAVERKAHGGRDRVVSNPAALRRRLAGPNAGAGGVNVNERYRRQMAPGFSAETGVAGSSRPSCVSASRWAARAPIRRRKASVRDTFAQARSRARHDLRADPGRVAGRHCYPGPVTLAPSFSQPT